MSDVITELANEANDKTMQIARLKAENAKLREQMERLVTLLRADCDIEASWDGLRKFWSIGLTEDGCLMRDRACKAEAENAKLRELAKGMYGMLATVEAILGNHDAGETPRPLIFGENKSFKDAMRELGVDE